MIQCFAHNEVDRQPTLKMDKIEKSVFDGGKGLCERNVEAIKK